MLQKQSGKQKRSVLITISPDLLAVHHAPRHGKTQLVPGRKGPGSARSLRLLLPTSRDTLHCGQGERATRDRRAPASRDAHAASGKYAPLLGVGGEILTDTGAVSRGSGNKKKGGCSLESTGKQSLVRVPAPTTNTVKRCRVLEMLWSIVAHFIRAPPEPSSSLPSLEICLQLLPDTHVHV